MDKDFLIEQLIQHVIRLEEEVSRLRCELEKYRHPKNSNNSSLPPSKDENRPQRNKSLREKSDKNVGGQKGHEGHSLMMRDNPDIIETHIPGYCNHCGKDLSEIADEFVEKRQVIDIPIVKPICTEHHVFQKRCTCGHVTKSSFPGIVSHTVQYGPNTEALVSYLHSRQYVSFNRIEEMLQDIFGLSISEGGIHCLLRRFTEKAGPFYMLIKIGYFHLLLLGQMKQVVK